MIIVTKQIKDLIFDPINARKHPVKNIDAIKGSLTKFGQQKPIVINNKGIVIAGNGTLMAAKDLGWKSINCVVSELDDINQMAFALADNRTSELAEWDKDILEQQLAQLELNDFDIDGIGFEDFELPSDKEGNDGLTDPDEVPEVPQNVFGVKRGDIWLLGNHRLMCGDSTSEDDVKKLMDGKKADMVFTSPPYNGDTHLDYGKGQNKKLYENNTDKWTSNEYVSFCRKVLTLIFEFTNGFVFWNVNYNAKSRFQFIESIYPYCSRLWETIVWKKTGMPISNGLTRNYEFIFCFKNGERNHLSEEFKTEFNLWEIDNKNSQDKDNHRACFPVELPGKGITIGSKIGNIIYEPFCGSGSTLIACEKTGRICYGMELDEHYCSVIIKRWQDFTGKQAIKDGGLYE